MDKVGELAVFDIGGNKYRVVAYIRFAAQIAYIKALDLVGNLIEDYETEHHRLPEATGVDALRFLIAQHRVKQGELPEIGSHGVVSEIFAGKRELNLRQVRALAKRFAVSAATFV